MANDEKAKRVEAESTGVEKAKKAPLTRSQKIIHTLAALATAYFAGHETHTAITTATAQPTTGEQAVTSTLNKATRELEEFDPGIEMQRFLEEATDEQKKQIRQMTGSSMDAEVGNSAEFQNPAMAEFNSRQGFSLPWDIIQDSRFTLSNNLHSLFSDEESPGYYEATQERHRTFLINDIKTVVETHESLKAMLSSFSELLEEVPVDDAAYSGFAAQWQDVARDVQYFKYEVNDDPSYNDLLAAVEADPRFVPGSPGFEAAKKYYNDVSYTRLGEPVERSYTYVLSYHELREDIAQLRELWVTLQALNKAQSSATAERSAVLAIAFVLATAQIFSILTSIQWRFNRLKAQRRIQNRDQRPTNTSVDEETLKVSIPVEAATAPEKEETKAVGPSRLQAARARLAQRFPRFFPKNDLTGDSADVNGERLNEEETAQVENGAQR